MFRRWRVARAGALATVFVFAAGIGGPSPVWSSCESGFRVMADRFQCSSDQYYPNPYDERLSEQELRRLLETQLVEHYELMATLLGRALDYYRRFDTDAAMKQLAQEAPIDVGFSFADSITWRYEAPRPRGSKDVGDSLVRVLRRAEGPATARVFAIQLAAFQGPTAAAREARRLSERLDEEALWSAARV